MAPFGYGFKDQLTRLYVFKADVWYKHSVGDHGLNLSVPPTQFPSARLFSFYSCNGCKHLCIILMCTKLICTHSHIDIQATVCWWAQWPDQLLHLPSNRWTCIQVPPSHSQLWGRRPWAGCWITIGYSSSASASDSKQTCYTDNHCCFWRGTHSYYFWLCVSDVIVLLSVYWFDLQNSGDLLPEDIASVFVPLTSKHPDKQLSHTSLLLWLLKTITEHLVLPPKMSTSKLSVAAWRKLMKVEKGRLLSKEFILMHMWWYSASTLLT